MDYNSISRKTVKILFSIAIFFLTMSMQIFAGETGKIAGVVKDKQSGEPLLGVNVIIKGTTMGAATDEEGKYYIINVPPGTYTLQASAIGYHKITIQSVVVHIDLTTEINIELESSIIETPTVVVTAEQKMVQKDITSTRRTVSRDKMQDTPGMESTADIFKLQGGTVLMNIPQTLQLNSGEQLQLRDESVKDVHIRGGRGGEILFLIDGVPVTHPIYGGRSAFDLDVNSVDQVELLTGAFSAEYGQAQSGVVNITTRSGTDEFKGGLEYKTDQFKFLGTSYNTDYGTLFLGGPEPFTRYLFPMAGLNIPGKLYYFLSLNAELTNTAYNNFRTRNKIDLFGFKVTERENNLRNITGKLGWEITSNFKTTFSYIGSFNDWSDFDWLWINNSDHLPAYLRDNKNLALSFNHVLSKSTYYNINLGYLGVQYHGDWNGYNPSSYWSFFKDGQSFDYNSWKAYSHNYSVVPDSFMSMTRVPQPDPLTGFYDGAGIQSIWRDDNTGTWTLKGDLTSQMNQENLVKFGFEYQYNDIQYTDIQFGGVQLSNYGEWAFNRDTTIPAPIEPPGPFPEFSQNRWVFHVYPTIGSGYIQDKFEKEFLIINAGLRFDWVYLGKTVDSRDWKNQWEAATGLKSDWNLFKYKFSPRFGISFPITERTVVFFSYGHFYQLPELQYFYRDPYSGGTTGNPHLDYERTILYEFGLTHQFFDDLAVDIKSYTKDISQQVGTTQLKGNLGIPVQLFDNKSYGRARGIEVELDKRYSNFTSGQITYTLQWADAYSSSAFEDYIRSLNDFPYPIRERRADWDVRHQVIFQGSFIIPRDGELEVFGVPLPDNLTFTILSTYQTGQPYTPFTLDPAEAQKLDNTATGPAISSTDLKISKGFDIGAVTVTAEMDVYNIFDQNNVQIAYGFNRETGKPYAYGDLQEATNQYYDWYTMYRLRDPRQFSTGRYFKLGLRIDW